MRRILAFAICGLSLGACTSSEILRLDHPQMTLQLESEPPGADAKVSTGATCKTPCSVPVEGNGELTVTYTLEGYEPQEVAVQILPPVDPRDGPARISPNPVHVQLAAIAKPEPRRRAIKRRPAAKKPAAKPSSAKKPAAKKTTVKKPAPERPATAPQPAAAAPPPAEPAPSATPAPAAPTPAPAAGAGVPPPMPTTPPPAQLSPWPATPGQPPAKQ